MNDPSPPNPVRYGDFPFAVSRGANESRFLTWLRNHSNYMAVGGPIDYLRIGAVLIRGITINLIVLMPPLMLAAVILSALHPWMHDRFILTPIAVLVGVGWMLFFPVISMLTRIAGYKRSLASGSDSSVTARDRYERWFAIFLVIILGTAIFELLPHLVDLYGQLRGKTQHLPSLLVLGSAALGSLSAAPKLLKALGPGVLRKIAIVVIGVGGILVPVFLVVVITDFIVNDSQTIDPDHRYDWLGGILVFAPIVYTFGIGTIAATGFRTSTFSGREYWKLFLILLAIWVLHALLFVGFAYIAWKVDTDLVSRNLLVLAAAIEILIFGWLTVDVNQTSVHALYRDRLASAFLLGVNAAGEVDIEEDVPLSELNYHETGAVAPYHLINVAINLQGSDDIGLRDRHSDFFIFSKKFIGGARTGYCRSASMEQVFPQVTLASAMAISAAAASPNMGRGTSPALVAFMTMINVRLGVWVPHPGRVEEHLARHIAGAPQTGRDDGRAPGFSFADVFADELHSLERRWKRLGDAAAGRTLAESDAPTVAHGLLGLAFSGGGIRSAALNLGITQALHHAGLFRHFDYMSTVSGGGYLGSSISTLMRFKTLPVSEIAGKVAVEGEANGRKVVTVTGRNADVRRYEYAPEAELEVKEGDEVRPGQRLIRRPGLRIRSEIAGKVKVDIDDGGRQIVTVTAPSGETREYRYTRYDDVAVDTGDTITTEQPLVKLKNTFGDRFHWRVRPTALLLEMTMRLDERHRWVNLSDGGHIENLAAIELLRRRCKLIVIGDGECDPPMYFPGLATLLRTARIDLGIHIEIDLAPLRLESGLSRAHFVVGEITYPDETERGYLVYLKSSCTGDEDEVIGQYRHHSPTFPHETTADQFFNEGQFEAYRSLGQHIGKSLVKALPKGDAGTGGLPCAALVTGVEALWNRRHDPPG